MFLLYSCQNDNCNRFLLKKQIRKLGGEFYYKIGENFVKKVQSLKMLSQ